MMRSARMLYVMNGDLDNIKVLGQVMMYANKHKASLTLLDVIDSLPATSRMLITAVSTGELRNRVVRNRLEQLEDLISRIGSEADELRPRVLFGNYAKEITREAAEGGYDLVIKSIEQGMTDRYLLRNCICPVWLLNSGDYDASGQLIDSHSPHVTIKDKVPAVESTLVSGTRPHDNWFSRAQDLFR